MLIGVCVVLSVANQFSQIRFTRPVHLKFQHQANRKKFQPPPILAHSCRIAVRVSHICQINPTHVLVVVCYQDRPWNLNDAS
jgi:hypothetical protein